MRRINEGSEGRLVPETGVSKVGVGWKLEGLVKVHAAERKLESVCPVAIRCWKHPLMIL